MPDISDILVDSPTTPINSLVGVGQPPYLTDIKTAIMDAEKVETTPSTPLPSPANFQAIDLTNNAPNSTPGDKFAGVTTGITAQDINPTPDNLFVLALTPGTFIATNTGNDILVAAGGRNILDATSGHDTFIGGSGQDTFLADIRASSATDTLVNFKSGDDLAVVGLTRADFSYAVTDTPSGMHIDTVGKTSDSIVLPGYTFNDLTGATPRLKIGFDKTPDGLSFLYIHAN